MRTMILASLVAVFAAACGGGPDKQVIAQGVAAVPTTCPVLPVDVLLCGPPGTTYLDTAGVPITTCDTHDAYVFGCNINKSDGSGPAAHCVSTCPDGLLTGSPRACDNGEATVGTDCGIRDAYGVPVFSCALGWGRECTSSTGVHCVLACPAKAM